MEIDIFNLDNSQGIPEDHIRRVTDKACQLADLKDGSCTVIFQNDEEISALHQTYFDDPSVTDVITFNLGDEYPEAEIYICLDQAVRQSREFRVSVFEEISRLIIHGILHVAGYLDDTPENRLVMKAREDEILHRLRKEISELPG